MMNEQTYCGIDVAKRHFVIGLSTQKRTKTETNNPKGIAHTIEYLRRFSVDLIVLESTGGLELPLAKALHRTGFRVVIANPRQTNQFAMSQSLAKTDNKDAKMLAFYAQMLAMRDNVAQQLYIPPTPEQEQLEALVSRRNQLVEMRFAEKNRLEQVHSTQVFSVEQHIDYLSLRIDELDREIEQHLKHFDDTIKKFKDIKGLGTQTIAVLMSMLPELGQYTHKQIASLVGVAPHPKESGNTKWKSRCSGGRKAVRNALYMATFVCVRFEPKLKQFYERLRANGKAFKVAINACMRKLLTILNAIVRDDSQWDAHAL
ncbi:IS110 family transposase [Avibacterium paragallinarum]|uniref:ISNme5, family IS110 n=8 Tax=Avibacterium paragallinarum TaxID=728 RepID=A0A377IUJ7_AVIPA|nr:IS110 family transposase [Avibacterium paragallinarum]STO71032.1 ISNme5, family IS110 [Avibacterium paragallinarum]STO71135.1 ISNme5, family IS110 [Avibacterium paragallinarum]STO71464.1 ISNme5, family IS110 [Avibacterium paragallinarum]STO71599.1 ISNme5, family IS110 [Avibacterium paragallinarum]STO71756.1 ISNme5, family IS110 [Avibacterium paragallinarum]